MLKAMEKQGPDYGTITSVESDFSFHDLMGRLLGGEETIPAGAAPSVWHNSNGQPVPTGRDYTPLGRHQWEMND
jgi:hypothetical protein